MKKISCLILLLLLAGIDASAYTAILVMLRGERKKIEFYQNTGQSSLAKDARSEAGKVMKITIKDFTDNFSMYPVYYFVDSNLSLIKEKKFEGIILDKNMKVVSPPPVSDADPNFLIVYYGIPPTPLKEDKDGNNDFVYQSVTYPGDGLVILGPDFKRKKYLNDYLYKPQFWNDRSKQYSYISKKFDMGYRPYAKHLQDALN